MQRDALVGWLDDLLDAHGVPDGQPNGLQVEGRAEVRRVVLGVSACEELFQRAVESGADAVLTHHGLLWGPSRVVAGAHRRRLKLLLDHDLNLLSYHLPLDRHPEVGHNAVAARALGLEGLAPFGSFDGVVIGVRGALPRPVPRAAFVQRLAKYYEREPLVFPHGPDPLRSVAVVSGAGQGALEEAIAEGLDAFVTGEVREQTLHIAKEGGVTFASCGHHATERVGLLALAERLSAEGLDARFVDVPNPV